MNKKQRIAIILLVLAIAILIISLVVKASIESVSNSEEMDSGEVDSEAKVSLTILPPRGIEDKGSENLNGQG